MDTTNLVEIINAAVAAASTHKSTASGIDWNQVIVLLGGIIAAAIPLYMKSSSNGRKSDVIAEKVDGAHTILTNKLDAQTDKIATLTNANTTFIERQRVADLPGPVIVPVAIPAAVPIPDEHIQQIVAAVKAALAKSPGTVSTISPEPVTLPTNEKNTA